jgi:hypothetical protein
MPEGGALGRLNAYATLAGQLEMPKGMVAHRNICRATLSALATDDAACNALLAAELLRHPALDRRAQAAFMIGRLTRAVCLPFAASALHDRMVPAPAPDAVEIVAQAVVRGRGDGTVSAVHYSIVFTDAPADHDHRDRAGLMAATHTQLIRCLAPIVRQLNRVSGLSPGALWRLVADMVCSAFLHAGQHIGNADEARAMALAATRQPGSPLNNGRSGFQRVILPDVTDPSRTVAEHWFITRSGCCRWYTSAGGELCTICVLRTPEEQQERLRTLLRNTLAAET